MKRMKGTCLLIVDVQKGFVNEHTLSIPMKVEALQSDYGIVFATKFYNSPSSLYRKLIGWNKLDRDSDDFELAFDPKEDVKIVEKPIYTCVDKLFIAQLQSLEVTRVDVCGIDTDICVTKCAVDLFENGVEPRVLAAYCGSNAGPSAHQNALLTLERFIGKSQVVR